MARRMFVWAKLHRSLDFIMLEYFPNKGADTDVYVVTMHSSTSVNMKTIQQTCSVERMNGNEGLLHDLRSQQLVTNLSAASLLFLSSLSPSDR